MKLVVTGATGYIGERLVNRATRFGNEVVAASRRPVDFASCWLPFELSSTAAVDLPAGTDAVIHLAADVSATAREDRDSEVLAARSLIAAAQQAAAKFVFVSSQAARQDAPTAYGRTKWRIEQEVLATGGWVIRPGQVYGGPERGLFGALAATVRRLPVLPAFLPAPKVQPIHVDDLAEGLLKIVERDDIPSCVLCLGSPEPISFTQFLLAIADARVRRQRFFIPVPVVLIKLLGDVVGSRLRIRLGLERLNSLFELPLMDTACDLCRLRISLRSLPSGMHPSGDDGRRQLIGEGRALLTYVLKESPGTGLLCRYVRAVENLRAGCPLGLPTWALTLPATLALFEDRAFALWAPSKEFAWRLHAATALAEATTRGAYRFLGLARSSSVLISLLDIARALLAEVSWRLLRIACAPLLHRSMRTSQSRR